MNKLKISVLLLIALVSKSAAQQLLDPYKEFFSNQLAYVITQEGDSISGYLRGAAEASGFIRKLTIMDENGQKHKFKAEQLQRFAIQPGVFAKIESVADQATSLRKIIQADFHEILERDWLIYDSQTLPRRKNKTGLLQLLNPGFDENIKVYNHPNGSRSMPLGVGGIKLTGGEDRTFLVVKGNGEPQVFRKAGFKKSFTELFADEPDFVNGYGRDVKFKHLAIYIAQYNELKARNELSAEVIR